jgi:hypothetical protein
MNNLRWANPEHIGICYDTAQAVVYLDAGPEYEAAISGQYGPIAPSSIIEGGTPVAYTPDEAAALRQAAYQAESDPLYFKWQRGEATQQEWLGKIAEIKTRYPIAGE